MRPFDRLRIGLAQTDAELGNVPANVARVVDLVHSARGRVDVLVLPELALTGYSVGSRFYDLSLRTDDPQFQQLLDATDETMTLVVGFVEETDAFQFFNSLAFIRGHRLIHTHRKIYLPNYGVFEERKFFSAGRNFDGVDVGKFRLAPFICGDAWNPASVHLAAADQAHVLVIAACSPEGALGSRLSSRENWKRLNRFYAAIFGCYVAFVNRAGSEGPLHFWGESELIDPFGQTVVASSTSSDELLIGEIDLGQIREARTVLHTLRDDDLSFLQRRIEKIMVRHYI